MSAFIENNNSNDENKNDENDGNNETIQINYKTPIKTYKRRISVTPQTENRKKEDELSLEKLMKLTPKQLETIIFEKLVNENIRKILELKSAKKQCLDVRKDSNTDQSHDNNYCFFNSPTIEQATENNKYEKSELVNSYCWLCGTAFHSKSRAIDCEHIIPLLFAVLFLGIETTEEKKNNFTKEMINASSLNYLYAHSSCNRKKSNLLLINWNGEKMVFDKGKADILQKRLLESKLVKVKNLIDTEVQNEEQIKKYKNDMMNNFKSKIEKICELINNEYKELMKDETSYVKYIINMSKLYLSKKHIEKLKNDIEIRKALTNKLGKKENIYEEKKKIIENAFEMTETIIPEKINEEITSMENEIENTVDEESDLLQKEKNIIYYTTIKLVNPNNNKLENIKAQNLETAFISNIGNYQIDEQHTVPIGEPTKGSSEPPPPKKQKSGGNFKRKTIKKRKQNKIRKTIKKIKSHKKIINN